MERSKCKPFTFINKKIQDLAQVVRSRTRLFLRSEKKSQGKPQQFFTYFGSTLMHKTFCRHLFHTKMFGNFKRSMRARRFWVTKVATSNHIVDLSVANHCGGSKINHVVPIINYLMFDYVVDYVIIESEALNTSIWFCCLSQNYLADYCSHGESRKKNYHHFKCAV